jgi:hypothetical protein
VPVFSSSPISPALEQFAGLPASERELLAAGHPGSSLLGYLALVPDPRNPRGVRHSLCSLLAAAIAAVLAGSRSFTAIGEWVADAPPSVLATLGIRRDPLTRRFKPPDEATIRRVLEAVDAEALDKRRGLGICPGERHPGKNKGQPAAAGSAGRGRQGSAGHPPCQRQRPGRAPDGRP